MAINLAGNLNTILQATIANNTSDPSKTRAAKKASAQGANYQGKFSEAPEGSIQRQAYIKAEKALSDALEAKTFSQRGIVDASELTDAEWNEYKYKRGLINSEAEQQARFSVMDNKQRSDVRDKQRDEDKEYGIREAREAEEKERRKKTGDY